jgi:F0F1-type ATP synthase assembly protein I
MVPKGSRDMEQPPLQDERIGLWTAGVEFAVVVGALTGGGYWLDVYTGKLPLWTLVGLATGFAAAMYRLIRQVRPKGDETPVDAKDEKTE